MALYTILEVTESEAKVLHMGRTKKTPLTIEAAFALDLSDIEKDEAGNKARGTRLREKLKECKVGSGLVAILLPKQNSIVRTALLPSSDAVELREMARFEAEKFIPFNVERHIISNGVLRRDDVQGSHVLITAVDRPVMEAAIAVATEAGLEPALAEVTSIGLARAYSAANPEPEHDSSLLLLSIGRTQTDISIIHDGLLAATRSQNLGYDKLLADIREALGVDRPLKLADVAGLKLMAPDEFSLPGAPNAGDGVAGTTAVGDCVRAWIQRLFRFTRQTVEFTLREQNIPAASRVYLTGEASQLAGLEQALSVNLNVEVVPFHPLKDIPRAAGAQVDELVLAGLSAAYGTALRLVEESGEPNKNHERVNLLPPELIQTQLASERKLLLVVSAAMVVITLFLLYLLYDAQASERAALADRYTAYNRKMKPLVDSLEEKKKQLSILRKLTSDRVSPMVILDMISTYPAIGSVPTGGSLTIREFKYGTGRDVTLAGDAINFEDIQHFADYLEKMTFNDQKVFSQVGLPQPAPSELSGGRGNIWTFTIPAMLNTLSQEGEE